MPAGLGANDIREILIRLNAVDNASPVIGAAGDRIQKSFAMFGRGMAFQQIGRGLTSIGQKMNDVTAGVITMGLNFNKQMQMVQTQAQLSDRQLQRTSEGALRIAKRFGQGTETITEGLYDVFSSTEVGYQGALRMVQGFARAATAGGTDVRTVSRSAIATMNALDMKAKDTRIILDNQFQAVRKGVFTYEQFAAAVGNMLPAGASMNQTLEDLTGSMAFLSRQGFTASQSAISVARAMDQLTRNRGDIEAAIGVDIVDKATGEYKQLGQIMEEFAGAMDNMTSSEREKAFGDMFGAGEIRAMRFFRLAVPRQQQLNDLIADMGGNKVAGQMKKAYDIMKDSPAVRMQILLERIKAIGVELGQIFLPALEEVVKVIRKVVEWFDNLSPSVKKWIAIGFAFVGVVLTIAGAVLSLIGGFLLLKSILIFTGTSLAFVVGVTAGVIVAIAALIAIGLLLYKNWDFVKKWAIIIWNEVSEAFIAAWEVIKAVALATWGWIQAYILEPFWAIYHVIQPIMKLVWNVISSVFMDIWETIKFVVDLVWTLWQGFWGVFSAIFKAHWQVFWAVFKTAWDILWEFLKVYWKLMMVFWKAVWEVVKFVWNTVGKPIFEIVKAVVKALWDFIKPIFDFISDHWAGMWEGMKKVFFGIINGIIAGVETFANAIIKAINWIRTKFGLEEIALVSLGRVGLQAGSYGSESGDTSVGGLAKGTNNWRGGWAMVGEKGPELAYLPRGAKVIPNGAIPGFANGLDWAAGALTGLPGGPLISGLLTGAKAVPGVVGSLLDINIPNMPAVFKEVMGAFLGQVKGWMVTAMKELVKSIAPAGGAGAWGGFANGRIPLGAMTQVQPGKYLEPMAALAFQNMQRGYGSSIPITSAYRSYALQATMYANRASNPYPVAPPGTSNHGWGKAVDIASGTSYWSWMMGNASRYGWMNLPGDAPHFDYKGLGVGGKAVTSGLAMLHRGESVRPANTIADYRNREKHGEFHLHMEPQKAQVDEQEIVDELDWMRRTRGW